MIVARETHFYSARMTIPSQSKLTLLKVLDRTPLHPITLLGSDARARQNHCRHTVRRLGRVRVLVRVRHVAWEGEYIARVQVEAFARNKDR